MADTQKLNSLELHYHFNDKSHFIDAFVRNRCEKELLAIIHAISRELRIQTKVEVEAKKEGGLIEFYNFLVSSEGQALPNWGIFIASLVSLVIINRKTKEDKEEQKLRIENLKLQNEKARKEAQDKNLPIQNITEEQISLLIENIKIKKLKSNLYKKLQSSPKVEKFETTIFKDNNHRISSVVNRNEFFDYIIETDNIEPLIDKECKIEIISPVLKKGKYKWRGLYLKTRENIEFSMTDKDFKEDIVDKSKSIAFQTGTFIDCDLYIERKTDDDGNIINSSYKVNNVYRVYFGDSIVETSTGKKTRKKKEADRIQLDIFNQTNQDS